MLAPGGGALLLTIRAHQEFITDARLTATGQHLITIGSRDPVIRVWDPDDGRLLRELQGSDAAVNAIALLSDDAGLLAGDAAGVVRRWDHATGDLVYEIDAASAAVLCLTVDAAEQVAVVSAEDGTLTVLDLADGAVRHQIAAHKLAIRYLFVLSTAGQAVTVSSDRHVKVWSLVSGELIHDWTDLEDRPTAVLLSADECTLVVGDMAGTLVAWDLAAGELRTTFAGHSSKINHLVWTDGDNTRLASAVVDGLVNLWQVGQPEPVASLAGHDAEVWRLAASPDGRLLASGAKTDEVIIWDLPGGEKRHTLPGHDRGAGPLAFLVTAGPWWRLTLTGCCTSGRSTQASCCACCPAMSGPSSASRRLWATAELMSAGQDGAVCFWRTTPSVQPLPGHRDDPRLLQPVPAATALASAGPEPTVIVWDSTDGSLRHRLLGHTGNVTCLLAGPPEAPLLSGAFDGSAKAWDVTTGELLLDMAGHTDAIRAMLVTADNRLITAASDKAIHVWDLADGALAGTLAGHIGGVLTLDLVGDGTALVSLGNDGQMKLWDLTGLDLIADLSPAIRASTRYQLDDARQTLMAINMDGQPHVWHLDGPATGQALEGHTKPLSKVRLSGDGLVAASAAGAELILWDAATGVLRARPAGHVVSIDALLFDSSGQRLVSADHDGLLKLWDTADGGPVADLVGHTAWISQLVLAGVGQPLPVGRRDRTDRPLGHGHWRAGSHVQRPRRRHCPAAATAGCRAAGVGRAAIGHCVCGDWTAARPSRATSWTGGR